MQPATFLAISTAALSTFAMGMAAAAFLKVRKLAPSKTEVTGGDYSVLSLDSALSKLAPDAVHVALFTEQQGGEPIATFSLPEPQVAASFEVKQAIREYVYKTSKETGTALASVMRDMSLVLGHGHRYVERIVWEGRPFSPEAAEKLLEHIGHNAVKSMDLVQRMRDER